MGTDYSAGINFEVTLTRSERKLASCTNTELSGKETTMGYRCFSSIENAGDCEFRLMEVVMVKKSRAGENVTTQVIIIDNNQDTLRHVQENWNEFIDNVIRVKKMEDRDRKKIADSADIFGKGLQPFFSRISESSKNNLLANLSKSMKKALILMALERYEGNKEIICKVLGINRDKLENEMSLCGLDQVRKAA
jgi:DNA-binding protein Fis